MKHFQLLAAGLTLSTLSLCACSEAPPPKAAQVASQQETPKDAAAPAAEAAPKAASALTPEQLAAAKAEAAKRATDPANARGGKRYEGGTDNKLESAPDLSKVKLPVPGADEHAGHDHGAEAVTPNDQDGRQLLPAAQAAMNQGRIELTDGVQQVKDLGKLRQGESASFEFPFLSSGKEPLVVTGVKPSCGCTKAEVVLIGDDGAKKPYTKGDPIPVGQRFVLESEISTDGKPGGPFNAQISIYANDARGAYNVRLTAEIEPVLVITPNQTVFFGHMTTADKAEQALTITTTRGEPFRLTLGQDAVQEPLQLEYTAKNPDAEGKSNEWEVKVGFGPNGKIGMNSYPITFKTDLLVAHPKYPSPDGTPTTHNFMVNVQAQVSGMVSAEPSFLTFGMVRPGEAIERSLRIECHDTFKLNADIPVVFEGLQGQEFPFTNAFVVTVEPLEEGKAANLKVQLKGMPEDLNGSFGGVLRVKVGHPFMEELQVRFSGVCRPGLPVVPTQKPAQSPAPNQPQKE